MSRTKKTDVLQQVLESLDEYLLEGIFLVIPGRGIVFVNNILLKMFGFQSLMEIQRTRIETLFGDEEARVYIIDKINAVGLIKNERVLCRRKDGTSFWVRVTCIKSTKNGAVYYQGLIHDITNEIRTEEHLKENKIELEKLTMELDRFIYCASHDIRSPVSTILGLTNLMKLDLKEEPANKYIQLIEATAGRLDQFVRELTAHAMNSKNPMDDEPIDFELLIHNLLKEFNNIHPNFGRVSSTLTIKNQFVFYSDADRLRLILYNIIKNSLDFSDLRKSKCVLSIDVLTEPDKCNIEIFDNGIGIAAVHVDRVFDMFYRATDKSKGSGIGLYTAREATYKLNGIVTLHSEYGIGTTVKIELPNSRKGKLINKKNYLRHR